MRPEEAKTQIRTILGAQITFEGHFDKCFSNLKENQQKELIFWIGLCKDHQENPIISRMNKDLIGFVKKFQSNLRAILTKEKQGYFLVLFLDKHKYYDEERSRLGF